MCGSNRLAVFFDAGTVSPPETRRLFVGALVDKEVRRLDIEGGQVVAEDGIWA